MAYNLGNVWPAQANTRAEFLENWAKKYVDTISWIEVTEGGGVDWPEHPKECFVKNDNTVIVRWDVKTDELVFEDGRILENGEDRLQEYKDGGYCQGSKERAEEFQEKYVVALKVYDMKHSANLQRRELAEKLETLDVVKDFLEYPVGVVDDETKGIRLNHYANLLRKNDSLQKAEAKAINWGNTEGYKSARRDIHENEKELFAWEKKLLDVYSPKDVADTKRAVEEEIDRWNAEFATLDGPSSDSDFVDLE